MLNNNIKMLSLKQITKKTVFAILLFLISWTRIYSATPLLIDPSFINLGTVIGDTIKHVDDFSPSSSGKWLATDDGNQGRNQFGDQWLVDGNGAAVLEQNFTKEAQALIQWVDVPECPSGHKMEYSDVIVSLDWSYDTSNSNYKKNQIDLRMYIVGWNDDEVAPRVDSQNPNVGAGDEFDLEGGTRLDGKTGDTPLVLINNNVAHSDFPGLTANDGTDTLTIELTSDAESFDNFAIIFYGEAAGASFSISETSVHYDCILVPEPSSIFFLLTAGLTFITRRKRC